ncbi:FAD-dependent oxidoreductase [Nonomuraea sp. 3-1Str]|uniref:FAD-binding oxidoreductase n=1 Tax=Nonomuraea sp. 3-1Str TaxID=2929801 RepID=UPI00285F55BF|nr:FAD-binding protein [Nonomuraea sp. 3-1Str]MDR8410036.1 FAD-dependent oxidoreductase [Nonomuraea sp. 3-1Str]
MGDGGAGFGDAVRRLRASFGDRLHLPGEPGYDAHRPAWNLVIDPRPAIVAEAAHPDDVRAAVLAAREHGLPLTVQATGHGTHVPADGGLLLKTGRLGGVRVDPERRTARAGAGARWSDVIAAAAPYGLAPLSGTPGIGVTGYTLGGGTGWLSRRYGYAADALTRAELVTAAGEPVTAGGEEHPELFWALRGGGGNFGVVTELEFRLFPVAEVYAGMTLHPVERAADTLARYREWAPAAPDELNTSVILMRMPGGQGDEQEGPARWALAVRGFYAGDAERGRQALAPLLEAAGPVLGGGFGAMTFGEAATAFGGPEPAPMAVAQHLELLPELPDGAVRAVTQAAGGAPSRGPAGGPALTAVEVRHWGGAMARPEPDAGPVGHRDVPFSVIATAVLGAGPSTASAPDAIPAASAAPDAAPGVTAGEEVRDLAGALRPYATGGSFLNFLTDPARTRDAYTPADHARLRRVKRDWDPDNLLGRVHNIPPA